MRSNHPWPLLWQRVLSRSLWPNYTASYEVVKVLRSCLDSAWHRRKHLSTTEWERREHSVVHACVLALFGHLDGWRSLSALHGRKLVLLPQDDNGSCHLDWGHVTTWQCMEFVCDNVTIPETWNVASSRLMEFDSSNADWWYTAEVQVRDPCTLTNVRSDCLHRLWIILEFHLCWSVFCFFVFQNVWMLLVRVSECGKRQCSSDCWFKIPEQKTETPKASNWEKLHGKQYASISLPIQPCVASLSSKGRKKWF